MKKIILLLITSTFFGLKAFCQDAKQVTLTTIGTGKTLEEAKLNSYRSAIEQAFGAFISSKTEILNDNLVKDEIVSLTNGNISNVVNISDIKENNNTWVSTNKVTVSVNQLSKFVKNKGFESNFDGSSFANNIKLMKMNELAEEKCMQNIMSTFEKLFVNIFNYEIETKEPVVVNELYKIEVLIKVYTNQNYNPAYDFLISSVNAIQPSNDEQENYKKIGKPIYSKKFGENIFVFRLESSLKKLMLPVHLRDRQIQKFVLSDGIIGSKYYNLSGELIIPPEGILRYERYGCRPAGHICFHNHTPGDLLHKRTFEMFYNLGDIEKINKITIAPK